MSCFSLRSLTVSTVKVFTLVKAPSTWAQAQAYCRQHYTDLALIENAAENSQVTSVIQSSSWIGLYREPWRWSSNIISSFTNWGSLGDVTGYNCAAENTDHLWSPQNCDQRLPFFCHGGKTQNLYNHAKNKNVTILYI